MSSTMVERISALEPLINSLRTICGSPGISIGVNFGGQVVHRSNYGYRDVEAQLPAQSDTVYAIGTLAKTFTASAIGILVSQGKLKWDTYIKDVLPDFQSVDPTVASNVTVLDLLCHRGGLSRSNLWWMGSDGELLLQKDKLLSTFNRLEPVGQFRASWGYSNWGYAVAGEVIEKVTGQTYGQFLTECILEPLGLKNTTSRRVDPSTTASNFAQPYAALDDASLHRLPQPPIHEGTIMVPAMGLYSTADDLLAYSMALLDSLRVEQGEADGFPLPRVLREVTTQLSGHAPTARSITEKSYALGYYRTQLPSTVAGMGCNAFHVKSMPKIVPGRHCGPLIAHAGSVPGYSSSLALLPELNASIVVCTNSIGLGDASGWIAMALVEALTEAPNPTDFRLYATEAARNHAGSVAACAQRLSLERARNPSSSPKPLGDYVGSYRDNLRDWLIVIRQATSGGGGDGLEVAFQGLDSQTWPMAHHEQDTFLWMAPRNDQAKRGRVTTYVQPDSFKLIFGSTEDGKIDRLYWPQEQGLALEKQCFVRVG